MNILEKLLNNNDNINILWTGNNGWLIYYQNKLIGIDLDLLNPERINNSLIDFELLKEHLNILLITHAHEDHFNSATIKLLKESNCNFIIPQSCKAKMKNMSINNNRINYVVPKQKIIFDTITIECTRALHGHKEGTIYRNASLEDCGYIISLGYKKLYQPGDTVLLEEHMSLNDIDILFISPTEHNTGINKSYWLVKKIKPKYTIAQHFGTYHENEKNKFWTHGYVNELRELIINNTNFIIPSQKEIITIKS